MPVGLDKAGRQFIETEPIGKDGEESEQKVWTACKNVFSGRDCIGYWKYPIFSQTGETRKEPDILIADRELGIIIVEVKGVRINQISKVDGHVWHYQNFYQSQGNPYQQAENQLYSLLGYCDREKAIRRQVTSRALVALPLITKKEWQEKGFDRLPSSPPIIFQDQLGTKSLLETIKQTNLIESGIALNDEQWEILLAVIGGTTVLRKTLSSPTTVAKSGKTRSNIVNDLRQRLYELDLQQAHIGSEIPPGGQRIRGIAGSGKTVLLCQKAANMHLKHPDWDIALVFFTRSLYKQIQELVDKWLRHYSCGEIEYHDNSEVQGRINILHAWGARDQPGFYRTICEQHGVTPLAVRDTRYKQPNEGLADICKGLLENKAIKPMFDAVLIDEGQDLVVDPEELQYQEKQVIYWMAYQSLRPCHLDHPEQRRLIWAYDEAQSLEAQSIPSAPTLFGNDPSLRTFVTGSHKGGIKKSEIMHRCYRTPGPILTAAHAIGMGLLNPNGMISGITRQKDWEAIGYQVEGDFRKTNETIKLHRPPKNSPNPIPDLWDESVIQFNIYNSRQEELTALANNIKHNINHDGLTPSEQILVVVLGNIYEAMQLETHVASFLMEQGIDIFVPSAVRLNQVSPKYPNSKPNIFWYKGGVTVSRIARAKGNEADMVYVIGLDNIAENANQVTFRNQLFVALTRARGWLEMSGIGNYPLYNEIEKVLDSGNTFKFTNKPPQRDLGGEELEE